MSISSVYVMCVSIICMCVCDLCKNMYICVCDVSRSGQLAPKTSFGRVATAAHSDWMMLGSLRLAGRMQPGRRGPAPEGGGGGRGQVAGVRVQILGDMRS